MGFVSCCVRFQCCQYEWSNWLWRSPPKWLNLCRVPLPYPEGDSSNLVTYLGLQIGVSVLAGVPVWRWHRRTVWWWALRDATASSQISTSLSSFHFGSASSSRSLPLSTRRWQARSKQPGWQLLPRHRRPPKKTALGWHSYASRQSDVHQLPRQSLQCSWTSSLELSANGTQTAGLVMSHFRQSPKNVF